MAKKETSPQPWDRRPGESVKNYSHFLLYRNLGPERTSLKAYLQIHENAKEPSGGWSQTLKKENWRDRAEAWDMFLFEKAEEGWTQRGIERAEEMWTTTSKLLDACREVLQMPVLSNDTPEGIEVTFRDAVFGLKVGVELQERALAAHQSTSNLESDVLPSLVVLPHNSRGPLPVVLDKEDDDGDSV